MNNKNIIVSKKFLVLFIVFFLTNISIISCFKEVNLSDLFIEGDQFISSKDLINNSSLELPAKLIFIKTKYLEKELKENLALKNISINRRVIPFGLKIYLQTRVPLALAESKILDKKVYGYVDSEGVFIPKEFGNFDEENLLPIKIIGWNKNQAEIISKIFKSYKNNIKDLKLIHIESNNFITLEEKVLKKIFLGHETLKIDTQLDLIHEIKKQLNQKNILKKLESLDITDTNNPIIKVFKP